MFAALRSQIETVLLQQRSKTFINRCRGIEAANRTNAGSQDLTGAAAHDHDVAGPEFCLCKQFGKCFCRIVSDLIHHDSSVMSNIFLKAAKALGMV